MGQGVNGVSRSRAVWHPEMSEGHVRKLGVSDVEGDSHRAIVIPTLRTQEKSYSVLAFRKICVQLCSRFICNSWTQRISQPMYPFLL